MAERPQTYDHLKSKKKPHISEVHLALDPEQGEVFEEILKEVRDARIRATALPDNPKVQEDLVAAEAKYEEIKDRIDDVVATFKFRSIGRKKFEKLVLAHPPTEEQVERAKKYSPEPEEGQEDAPLAHNPETFPPALIAACLVSPTMTVEQATEMWDSDDWTGTELMTLFFTAQAVNIRRATVNLPKG